MLVMATVMEVAEVGDVAVVIGGYLGGKYNVGGRSLSTGCGH